MEQSFDYAPFFNEALNEIRRYRNPGDRTFLDANLHIERLPKNRFLEFGGEAFSDQQFVLSEAKFITASAVLKIINALFEFYNYEIVENEMPSQIQKQGFFSYIICMDRLEVLFFKDFGCAVTQTVKTLKDKYTNKSLNMLPPNTKTRIISMVYEEAYLEDVGHNEDVSDPTRGTNLYSLRWMFESYFSENEYCRFKCAVTEYKENVEEALGYLTIKTLTQKAHFNYKRIVENQLQRFEYLLPLKEYAQRKIKPESQTKCLEEIETLRNHLKNDDWVSILYSHTAFAESFITAEWLFSIFEKAYAIDYSTVAICYFKSVEQLLYNLLLFHVDEGRSIQLTKNSKCFELTSQRIDDKFTIGAMAYFVKYNIDIFCSDWSAEMKTIAREKIFDYAKLRNGFAHKHNIHDWHKIQQIREETIIAIFMILGVFNYTEEQKNKLGWVKRPDKTDYQRLCEFTNHYSSNVFLFEYSNGKAAWYFSCPDEQTVVSESGAILYSGAYFREFPKLTKEMVEKNIVVTTETKRFAEECLPNRIQIGQLKYGKYPWETEPEAVCTIYEDGRFVYNVESERFSY